MTGKLARLGLVLLAAFTLAGCDEMFQDRCARAMQRAEKEEADGEYRTAINSYEDALDGTARTAEVHYRLALLYGDKLNDRLSALHHFQRYLELAPNALHAKEAKNFVRQTDLAGASSGGSISQQDSALLKNENLRLTNQITQLHAQLNVLRTELRATPAKGGAATDPVVPGSREYVVQPGDTLASIARREYRNSNRWKDIEDANFNRLGHKNKLKPGMTLIIPQ